MKLHIYDENDNLVYDKEVLLYRNICNAAHPYNLLSEIYDILINGRTPIEKELNLFVK